MSAGCKVGDYHALWTEVEPPSELVDAVLPDLTCQIQEAGCVADPVITDLLESLRLRLVLYVQAAAAVQPRMPTLSIFCQQPFMSPAFAEFGATLRAHVARRMAERAPVDVGAIRAQLAEALAQNDQLKAALQEVCFGSHLLQARCLTLLLHAHGYHLSAARLRMSPRPWLPFLLTSCRGVGFPCVACTSTYARVDRPRCAATQHGQDGC